MMATTQKTLDFSAEERADIEASRPQTKAEVKRRKWERFHAENPHVYALIVAGAVEVWNKGYRRWGFELIYNEIRWRKQCRTTGKPYKLPNDFKKPYVEKLVAEYPQFDSMFQRNSTRDS